MLSSTSLPKRDSHFGTFSIALEPRGIGLIHDQTDTSREATNNETKEWKDILNQVVTDDDRPAFLFEESHDIFACLDIAVSILWRISWQLDDFSLASHCNTSKIYLTHHSNIDEGKLVEIFENILQTTQQTIKDTKQEGCASTLIIIVPWILNHGTECLYDCHQERAEANTPKRCGGGSDEAVFDCDGTAWSCILGCKPPCWYDSSNYNMDNVLNFGLFVKVEEKHSC